MQKFEHDPTVGSRVMDLLSEYSSLAQLDPSDVSF
jgi:hypothetical protein